MAPGGCSCSFQNGGCCLLGVLSYYSEECLQGTGRTLLRASYLPRGIGTSAWLSPACVPRPLAHRMCPLPLFLCTVSVACSPPSWARAERGLSFLFREPAPKWECPPAGSEGYLGRGVSRDASPHSLGSEVDFLQAVLYLCGEMCHLSPTQFTLFSRFVKNKNEQ